MSHRILRAWEKEEEEGREATPEKPPEDEIKNYAGSMQKRGIIHVGAKIAPCAFEIGQSLPLIFPGKRPSRSTDRV